MAVSLTPTEVRVKYFSFFMSAQGLWADIFYVPSDAKSKFYRR